MKDMNLELVASVNVGLINAFRDWADTNGHRTYINVACEALGVVLPPNLGEVTTLNISGSAVGYFFIDNKTISFSCRFGGKSFECIVPIYAIMSIHSPDVKSSAMGLSGLAEAMAVQGAGFIHEVMERVEVEKPAPNKRAHLTVVK